jgi:hypothetical protein
MPKSIYQEMQKPDYEHFSGISRKRSDSCARLLAVRTTQQRRWRSRAYFNSREHIARHIAPVVTTILLRQIDW